MVSILCQNSGMGVPLQILVLLDLVVCFLDYRVYEHHSSVILHTALQTTGCRFRILIPNKQAGGNNTEGKTPWDNQIVELKIITLYKKCRRVQCRCFEASNTLPTCSEIYQSQFYFLQTFPSQQWDIISPEGLSCITGSQTNGTNLMQKETFLKCSRKVPKPLLQSTGTICVKYFS